MVMFYLRQPTVAQSIEYSRITLLDFYHVDSTPLWIVLDEEPHGPRCDTPSL